ncbi:MAG: hypothetical protein PHE43_03575 [Candidatus Nanoarchaeia archaeon]|nr:hypothetical protein [Candidatus Nanoarchaeia archaeon]
MKKTWEEILNIRDLENEMFMPQEKAIIQKIKEVPEEKWCPYLRSLGEYFHYCNSKLLKPHKLIFSPSDPIIQNMQDIPSLQLYCMGNYKKCIEYISFIEQKPTSESH